MPSETPKKQDTRRGIKILLGVSLALNLLIVFAVAGALLRDGGHRSGGKMPRGVGGGMAFIAALEKDQRAAVISTMRGAHRAQQFDGRAQRQEMLKLLRADTLDKEALTKMVSRQQNNSAIMQNRLATEWMSVVLEMNDAERAAYADRLEEFMSRRKKRK